MKKKTFFQTSKVDFKIKGVFFILKFKISQWKETIISENLDVEDFWKKNFSNNYVKNVYSKDF